MAFDADNILYEGIGFNGNKDEDHLPINAFTNDLSLNYSTLNTQSLVVPYFTLPTYPALPANSRYALAADGAQVFIVGQFPGAITLVLSRFRLEFAFASLRHGELIMRQGQ